VSDPNQEKLKALRQWIKDTWYARSAAIRNGATNVDWLEPTTRVSWSEIMWKAGELRIQLSSLELRQLAEKERWAKGFNMSKVEQGAEAGEDCASSGPCENTDKELWREIPGDYYSPSIHVTKDGRIGINVNGYVIVQSLRDWHALCGKVQQSKPVKAQPPPSICVHDLESAHKTLTLRHDLGNIWECTVCHVTWGWTLQSPQAGDVYPDHKGERWYIYGWPLSDTSFSTKADAKRAWTIAKLHAEDCVEKLADKVKDVLP